MSGKSRPVRSDGEPQTFAARPEHYCDGTGMDEETILKAIATGGTGFRVCAGHRVVNQGYVGTAAGAFHVHRAPVARTNFSRGPWHLY